MEHWSRLIVSRKNPLEGHRNIFAIGNLALRATPSFLDDHPQIAPVAIDQAKPLAKNLKLAKNEDSSYIDKGSQTTASRSTAVVDMAP